MPCHNQCIDIMTDIRNFSITTGIPHLNILQLHPLPSYSYSLFNPQKLIILLFIYFFSKFLKFQECYINESIQYIAFGDWLFTLGIILWRFIQIIVSVVHSFLSLSSILGYKCLLNQSRVERYWDCFQVGAVKSKSVINICVLVFI